MFEDLNWKSAARRSAVVIAIYLGLLYLLRSRGSRPKATRRPTPLRSRGVPTPIRAARRPAVDASPDLRAALRRYPRRALSGSL
jgi:hypothetical protein